MRNRFVIAALAAIACTMSTPLLSWGVRGHRAINQAAVRAIGKDGPAFLRSHEDWIVHLSTVPDSWRRPSDPFLKILEDPNHGWFREQFSFMREVPRSRYEFVLALYDEHQRLVAAGDTNAAQLTNVRWTGTLPYAAMESYERMVTGMRRYRDARGRREDTRLVELEIASYMGRLGHYTGDGAQPLHDTIHHDGWQGEHNPRGYTTDPRVHGRFESQFVDAMALTAADFQRAIPQAQALIDPFAAILAHLDAAAKHVEHVYDLDKSDRLKDGADADARSLVIQQMTRAAALLRDLTHTAWLRSGEPDGGPTANPVSPTHPHFNPATGSAPAPRPQP